MNATTINAAPFNANFTALQTCANAIDNTNIGVAGIYASQIIPTTVGQAVFGGTVIYTFPEGILVNGALASFQGGTAIALTNGGFLQTGATTGLNVISDYQGIQALNNGATSNLNLQILGGTVTTGGGLNVTGAIAATGGGGSITAATTLNAPTLIITNGTASGLFTGLQLESKANGATASYVPPVFTTTGTAVGSTIHVITGTATVTAGNGGTGSQLQTLSGSAAFTGSGTYVVTATFAAQPSATSGAAVIWVTQTSGTAFTVGVTNSTGATITSIPINWTALGT